MRSSISFASIYGSIAFLIRLCTLLVWLFSQTLWAAQYSYKERPHSIKESAAYLGAIYVVSWGIFPFVLPKEFKEYGSFSNWKEYSGEFRFEHDGPFWNWLAHPLSGSQLYLIYRAGGYSRSDSFGMAFLSSALFELAVENYIERPSVQDFYQTPVLGSILGVTLEKASMYLLNSGSSWGKVLGHILNPASLFWFYEGRVQVIPRIDGRGNAAISAIVEF